MNEQGIQPFRKAGYLWWDGNIPLYDKETEEIISNALNLVKKDSYLSALETITTRLGKINQPYQKLIQLFWLKIAPLF